MCLYCFCDLLPPQSPSPASVKVSFRGENIEKMFSNCSYDLYVTTTENGTKMITSCSIRRVGRRTRSKQFTERTQKEIKHIPKRNHRTFMLRVSLPPFFKWRVVADTQAWKTYILQLGNLANSQDIMWVWRMVCISLAIDVYGGYPSTDKMCNLCENQANTGISYWIVSAHYNLAPIRTSAASGHSVRAAPKHL